MGRQAEWTGKLNGQVNQIEVNSAVSHTISLCVCISLSLIISVSLLSPLSSGDEGEDPENSPNPTAEVEGEEEVEKGN